MDMVKSLLSHQCCLMKAGEDKLELARIAIDVADCENTGNRSLEFCSVDRDQVFVKVDSPIGHRSKLHGETEKRQHAIGRNLELTLGAFDEGSREHAVKAL